jgi:tetratricopeptide (TPR) repeat protein
MRGPCVSGAAFAIIWIIPALGTGEVQAQAPTHKHYAETEKAKQPAPDGRLAPRLQNLGKHAFPVSCKGKGVQEYFNQGINLAYGFNHAEAARSFTEVARRAPDCAMAYWGHALVLGPNINAPMEAAKEPEAMKLVRKAVSLRSKASPRERTYIDALALRYTGRADDRAKNDRAYADAMGDLHRRYPDDLDAATLYAESLMNLRPWDYWTRDGQPYPGTMEIQKALQSVMDRNSDHPGALHLWIHFWEPTATPERAEEAADRLLSLVPGAGHLVHMPSHIYLRVGRYADGVESNRKATAADEDYITQCRAQGIYPLTYYPHNIHMLWYAATMAGQGSLALEMARKTASSIPDEGLAQLPMIEQFLVVPYYAMVRFGRWEEILDEPEPARGSIFPKGIWRYARGSAFAATGELSRAKSELRKLRRIAGDPDLAKLQFWSPNGPASILRIAEEVLAGELAARWKNYDKAIAHLETAVRLEDGLIYIEPPDWHYPVRQSLGAILLEAGRPAEAETVYWEDLRRNPENGWSLLGLSRALAAQEKTELADLVEQRHRKAWAEADVTLTASRF